MKIFDVHLNEMMQDRLYIKLNKKWSLFIGELNLLGSFDEDDDRDFIPASNNPEAYNKISVQRNERMALARYENYDGREVDIDPGYHKAIFRKVFDTE